MRATGHPRIEFYGSATLTVVSLTALAATLPLGLTAGIATLAATTFLVQAGFALVVRHLFMPPLTTVSAGVAQ